MSTDLRLAAEPYIAPAEYRAISSSAVSSLALGVLSVLALLDWWMVTLPVLAIVLGGLALRQIRRRGEELAGARLAKIGLTLGLCFLITGVGRLSYVYATEVPEGYQRLSYAELQPATPDIVEPSGVATALEGKRVFIKGYMYQSNYMDGITTFLLVRDQGDCCFGKDPKITERIQVSVADPRGVAYTNRLSKVAGVFHVRPLPKAVNGPGGVLYQLDEAIVR